MKICVAILMVISLSIVSCANHNDDYYDVNTPFSAERVKVVTNKTEYMRNEGTVITIINKSSEPISINACSSDLFYFRDKWVQGKWVIWTNLDCASETLTSWIIEPNSYTSDTVIVRKPGTYRFWYPVHRGEGFALEDTIFSDAFTIH